MRWYEKLYVGEKVKKHRYETIQAVRNGRPMGFYVLTPADQKLHFFIAESGVPERQFAVLFHRRQQLAFWYDHKCGVCPAPEHRWEFRLCQKVYDPKAVSFFQLGKQDLSPVKGDAVDVHAAVHDQS